MNCSVTTTDRDVAEDIYGPNITNLKGRTTREKNKIFQGEQNLITIVLYKTLQTHNDVNLYIDAMFIDTLNFFIITPKRSQ